jgi:hypothetical protein
VVNKSSFLIHTPSIVTLLNHDDICEHLQILMIVILFNSKHSNKVPWFSADEIPFWRVVLKRKVKFVGVKFYQFFLRLNN